MSTVSTTRIEPFVAVAALTMTRPLIHPTSVTEQRIKVAVHVGDEFAVLVVRVPLLGEQLDTFGQIEHRGVAFAGVLSLATRASPSS